MGRARARFPVAAADRVDGAAARKAIQQYPNPRALSGSGSRCDARRHCFGPSFENDEGRSDTLCADLIVDASGRGNLVNRVLESVGRSCPEETAIGVEITYATAVFAV